MPALPKRRWLQFRLWMLLAAFIPAGIGSLWLGNYLDTRPVIPQPYVDADLQSHLAAGRVVFVAKQRAYS